MKNVSYKLFVFINYNYFIFWDFYLGNNFSLIINGVSYYFCECVRNYEFYINFNDVEIRSFKVVIIEEVFFNLLLA